MNTISKAYRKIVHLSFPSPVSGSPMISELVRRFDLTVNILKAQITPRKEGYMTLELFGTEEHYKDGVAYLREKGIKVASAAQKIDRSDEACVHCGTCIAICPSDALSLDPETREVVFDKERCAACGLCTRVCPMRAMHVELENGNNW